ncbi:MAG: hypothetical protein AAF821_04335 [Cyanobacteria bacterium P01_D01_bin.156]
MDSASHQTSSDSSLNQWHIVQQSEGHCDIIDQGELDQLTGTPQTWGPFSSRPDAIAKRVGLIRAGKCAPK